MLIAILLVLTSVASVTATGVIDPSTPPGCAGVFTYHYDNSRDGVNPFETILTPANVNSGNFGKLFSYPVDGYIYGEPLYVPGVSIPTVGVRNVVYVVTEHDSVYAFDADGGSRSPLWHTSFINPGAGITTIPSADTGTDDIVPEIGITSTPVIDPSGVIYTVAATKENGEYFQRIHALAITTGSELAFSPQVIDPTVVGNGAGAIDDHVSFDALTEGQRAALTEANGRIYIAFASHGDNPPYHGWVLGYSATNLSLATMYIDTPNGSDGGIWQGGNGIAVDSAGALYFVNGNGTFDANHGGLDYGGTALKLSRLALNKNQVMRPTDYFAPHNQARLSSTDEDMGDPGAVLLPNQRVGPAHLLITADKNGTVYLLDRDHLGHYRPAGDTQIPQEVPGLLAGGDWTPPAVFNSVVYFSGYNGPLMAIPLIHGKLSPADTVNSSKVFDYPGVAPSISADGTDGGIVWAIDSHLYGSSGPATLDAYDAGTMDQIYSSGTNSVRDGAGPGVKFTTPTVANGKVYIGTQTELDVYGLLTP
jgi:PQQ-like domain